MVISCLTCKFDVVFQAGDEGEDINPKVQLFLVNLQMINSRHRQFLPPAEFQNKYVRVSFAS